MPLIIAEASASVLFQFASLEPPAVADNAALLRPVPSPSARATTTCRFVERSYLGAGDGQLAGLARDASQAWGEVREQLAPFNDGSRRPQTGRPPAVEHALDLHRLLRSVRPEQSSRRQPTAVAESLTDRFATVGANFVVAVDDAVACGQVMAYGADLPFRESRLHHFLQGHRGSGFTPLTQTISGRRGHRCFALKPRRRASAVTDTREAPNRPQSQRVKR